MAGRRDTERDGARACYRSGMDVGGTGGEESGAMKRGRSGGRRGKEAQPKRNSQKDAGNGRGDKER